MPDPVRMGVSLALAALVAGAIVALLRFVRRDPASPERMGKLDAIINHMGNFFDCVKSRQTPLSDVASQHRSVTLCHLGNIAMRLGRKITWDPATEQIVGDSEANAWQKREQRKGYEIA